MSDLILPDSCKPHRRSVQLSDCRICVLIHKDTKRILCFAMQHAITNRVAAKIGCKVVDILHAHDYDKWAKEWRNQSAADTAEQDHAYLERENATRTALRKQLRDKMSSADVTSRKAIDSALHCLEVMEQRRQRYRQESFMINEAYEAGGSPGDDLVSDMTAKL